MKRVHHVIQQSVLRALLALTAVATLSGDPTQADTIRILDGDDDALSARFRLIGAARRRIDLACFELRKDDVSYAVLARLRDAALRGVEVRMVIDAYGNRVPPSVLAELVERGVQIRRYHPLQLKDAQRYLRRLHDKLLVADGRVMIVGGRNLGNVYFGRATDGNFRDGDAEVTGSTVDHANAYFQRLWTSPHVAPFCCRCDRRSCASLGGHTRFDSPRGIPLWSPAQVLNRSLHSQRSDRDRLDWGGLIRPVHDVPPQRMFFVHSSRLCPGELPDISDQLLALIESARREIIIQTPYLILSDRFEDALSAAVCREVCVRLLCNSLASIDKPIAHAGYVNQKREILRMGIEVWEYAGRDMLHAKGMLIDDSAVIGSYDLHPRSEYYDTEIAVIVTDAKFAAAFRRTFEWHFEAAIRADKSPGSHVTRRHTGLPSWRRIVWMQMLRPAALLLKKHL